MGKIMNNASASMSDRITELVKHLRNDVPDCLAAGVIDLSTGMLLTVETVDTHPPEVLDLLAAATFELFQGRNVVMIENIFKERRGVSSDRHYFQEVLVNSDNLTHLFIRMEGQDEMVSVVVCRRTVNVGMLFAQTRRVIKEHGPM
ncbi:hypothetical protein SAMN05414137_12196 [Streptacidiphilus jiangxiensis]|uniref:Roadblock/LAMTOR2 domain-containing protein n=2 Tax=Streptacidiphilus jiangxiensis TaxID=235985 RepID=A0A1H7WRY2_STRJI|nr:hypothetical protein [Streptacidiphilus jiangxiensis]SEM24296.1 hypothetical protein SAMN05414137_12196 [Streptacidiphilus jiangxiensis]